MKINGSISELWDDDTLTIYYEEIPVTIYTEYHPSTTTSWGYTEPEYDEIEDSRDWDFKVSLEDFISDIAPDIAEIPEHIYDSEDACEQWIRDNFDTIKEKYKEQILEHYYEEARKAAEEDANDQYDPYDESLTSKKGDKKMKKTLNEKMWRFTIPNSLATDFRDSIKNEDYSSLKDAIKNIYDAIYNHFKDIGSIDADDIAEWKEEVDETDEDEQEMNYLLSELYDLCDNIGVWIPVSVESDGVDEVYGSTDDSEDFDDDLPDSWMDDLDEDMHEAEIHLDVDTDEDEIDLDDVEDEDEDDFRAKKPNTKVLNEKPLKEGEEPHVRPNHEKMLDLMDGGVVDSRKLAENLLSWLPDDEIGDFIKYYEYDKFDADTDYGDDDLDGMYNESLKESTSVDGKAIKEFIRTELAGIGYSDRVEAVMDEFGLDEETAESYVWDMATGLGESLKEDATTLELQDAVKDSYNHFANDLGKIPSVDDIFEDIAKNYNGYADIDNTPESARKWWNVIAQEVGRQGLEVLDECLTENTKDLVKDRVYVAGITTDGLHKNVYVKGYDYGTDVVDTIKKKYGDDVKFDAYNPYAFYDYETFVALKPEIEVLDESLTEDAAKQDYIGGTFDDLFIKYLRRLGYKEDKDNRQRIDDQDVYTYWKGKNKPIFIYVNDDGKITSIDGTLEESLKEDTVKQNGKWTNKGKEGTHGTLRTKKAADAQRKAMFANGFEEDLDLDVDEEKEEIDIDDSLELPKELPESFLRTFQQEKPLEEGVNVNVNVDDNNTTTTTTTVTNAENQGELTPNDETKMSAEDMFVVDADDDIDGLEEFM